MSNPEIDSHPSFFLKTFGSPALLDARGSPVETLRKKDLALLVYLCVEQGRAHPRGKLATLLWANSTEDKARHSLTQALVRIQKVLGADALRLEQDTAEWRGALAYDARLLTKLSGEEFQSHEGLALYRGDFLAGFNAGQGAQDFEMWADRKQTEYRELALQLLEQWGKTEEERGDWSEALRIGSRAIEIDPFWEHGHRRVMRAWNALGERNRALRHYEKFVSWLATEVEDEPDPDTQALAEHLRSISAPPPSTPRRGIAPPPPRTIEPAPFEAPVESDPDPLPAETTESTPPLPPDSAPAREPYPPGGRARPRRSHTLVAGGVAAFAALAAILWAGRSEHGENGRASASAAPRVAAGQPSACPPGRAIARLVDEKYPDGSPIRAGERFTKTWTLRNTGACAWDSTYKLHYVNGELSLTHAEIPVNGSVPPGATYTFTVPMQAPNTPGTYREDWTLRDGSGGTVKVGGSKVVWAEIVVPQKGVPLCTADNAVAKFLGENYLDDTEVPAGESFTKTWTIRNSGACSWDSSFALRYVSDTNGQLSASRVDVPIMDTVPPGATHTFMVPMRAPRTPGQYREDWGLRDANGDTIRISGSKTIWAQIVVPQR